MYLSVLDQVADLRVAVIDVLCNLHDNFKIGESTNYLTVEGDAKIFVHLEALKLEYGKVLEWLIPFPGDFHILKTYQEVLLKVYFDEGLKQVAMA